MKNLSIITVNYNNFHGLVRTFESLSKYLKSKYIQWVVIDGNSSDGSKKFLSSLNLSKKHLIISESDLGIYDAMNKGVLNSFGDYVIFLNSGDTFLEDLDIFDVLGHLKCDSDVFLFGYKYKEKTKLSHPGWWVVWSLPTSHQSIIYKKSIFFYLSFDLKYKYASDYDHFFKLWITNYRITQIPLVLSKNESYGSDLHISIVQMEYLDVLKKYIPSFLACTINKVKFMYIKKLLNK